MYNKESTKEATEILSRITMELERQGKKQAELIAYLDLPRGTFSSWKAGRSRNFCEHLGQISGFLGMDAGYLVTGNDSESTIENGRERKLISLFRKLSVEKQDAMIRNIEWIVGEE